MKNQAGIEKEIDRKKSKPKKDEDERRKEPKQNELEPQNKKKDEDGSRKRRYMELPVEAPKCLVKKTSKNLDKIFGRN